MVSASFGCKSSMVSASFGYKCPMVLASFECMFPSLALTFSLASLMAASMCSSLALVLPTSMCRSLGDQSLSCTACPSYMACPRQCIAQFHCAYTDKSYPEMSHRSILARHTHIDPRNHTLCQLQESDQGIRTCDNCPTNPQNASSMSSTMERLVLVLAQCKLQKS